MNGRMGDLGGFSLKVKSDFSGFLLLCFDTDWLACLVSCHTYIYNFFWSGHGTSRWGKNSRQRATSPLCTHLTWDCTVGKQTQNNFPTKLPAGVAVEMEGKSERTEGALNSYLCSRAKVADRPHLVLSLWVARSGWNNTRSWRMNKITLKTTSGIMSGSPPPHIFLKQIISEEAQAWRPVARQSNLPNYLFG